MSVFARKNFKYLGFTLGKNGNGTFVRVHPKARGEMKARLKELASRRRTQKLRESLDKIKVYMRGWLNCYGIASMKNLIDGLNQWLYHRVRMCIWKPWKKARTIIRNLRVLGVPEETAYQAGNCCRGCWWASNTVADKMALTKERLIRFGFCDLALAHQSVHVNY